MTTHMDMIRARQYTQLLELLREHQVTEKMFDQQLIGESILADVLEAVSAGMVPERTQLRVVLGLGPT